MKLCLKSPSTEKKHLIAGFKILAMTNPGISFSLLENDIQICHYSTGNIRSRLYDIIGLDAMRNMIEVYENNVRIKIEGFIQAPQTSTEKALDQKIFVNNRYVTSRLLHTAIMNAYGKSIPTGVKPSYFLFLEIPIDSYDINIHPQKTDIQFYNQNVVQDVLGEVISDGIKKNVTGMALKFD